MLPVIKSLKAIIPSDIFLPLVFLTIYVAAFILAKGVLPTSEELLADFSSVYAKYGNQIVFLAALSESLILVNFLTPGQVAMALGAIFAKTGQTHLVTVVLSASIGSLCGYALDYYLGYFGFAKVIKRLGFGKLLGYTQKQLVRFGKRGLILGFVHSNIGSFLALSAGMARYRWYYFLAIALIATFFWAAVWGILIYSFGDIILEILKKYALLLAILAIAGMLLGRIWKGRG